MNRPSRQHFGYPQFVAGMCAQCVMRHQLGGNFGSGFIIQSSPGIYGSQLGMFLLGPGRQLLTLPLQIGMLGIGL